LKKDLGSGEIEFTQERGEDQEGEANEESKWNRRTRREKDTFY